MKFKFDLLVEALLNGCTIEEAMSVRRPGESQQQFSIRQNKGVANEASFVEVMARNKLRAVQATPEQERMKIDFVVFTNQKDAKGKSVKAWVDLPENSAAKGYANTVESKGNKIVNGNLLVELIGVGYFPGWLFTKANYISFESENVMQFIKASKLRDYMQKKLNQVVPGAKLENIVDVIDNPETNKLFPEVQSARDAVFPRIFRRPADRSRDPRRLKDAVTRVPWNEVMQYAASELSFRK